MKISNNAPPATLPESAQAQSRRSATTNYGASAVVKAAVVSPDARRGTSAPDDREAQQSDVQVALSPVARLLARPRTGIAKEEVDAARVSRLREELAQGTYEFDSQTLAKVLIDKELRWIRT